jgi:L-ascorbate metabolism protein UlaG (beta-lactamase superfamily)
MKQNVHSMLEKISWLGHDGFRIDTGKTIYIDPYQITTDVPADYIFITHDHYDHCSPEDIQRIQKIDTVIVTSSEAAKNLDGDIRVVKPGDRLQVDSVSVEVMPAYNINKQFHPRAAGMLGFIVTVDGVRVYHAGDTDLIPEMKTIKADIALLPVSGTYVMTAEEAAEAALAIRPGVAVPMHFASIVGSEKDAERFARLLAGKIEVQLLKKE